MDGCCWWEGDGEGESEGGMGVRVRVREGMRVITRVRVSAGLRGASVRERVRVGRGC